MVRTLFDDFEEMKAFNLDVGYLIVFQDRYYSIPLSVAAKMNCPDDMFFDYVEVHGAEEHVEIPEPEEIDTLEMKADDYKISVVKEEGKESLSLRVVYKDGALDDIVAVLHTVINSRDFIKWIKDDGLQLWSGRDEQDKLQDIRTMRSKYMDEHEQFLKEKQEKENLKRVIIENEIDDL